MDTPHLSESFHQTHNLDEIVCVHTVFIIITITIAIIIIIINICSLFTNALSETKTI